MLKLNSFLFFFFVFISSQVYAVEIKGVNIPDSVTLANNVQLSLNGAGIRKKFFFKIYIGALYLDTKSTSVQDVLANEGPKRVLMHFLYDEVAKEKLTGAWQEGFKANNSAEKYTSLESRLMKFNSLFSDAKKGDVVILDYVPDVGTQMSINGESRGTISGHDFNLALLKVWLGESPADKGLKKALLGQ